MWLSISTQASLLTRCVAQSKEMILLGTDTQQLCPRAMVEMQVLMMEKKNVAQHYLKGWFTLDVVASFPLDLIFAGKRMDMWRLPRLLKVIRVMNYKSLTHACRAPDVSCSRHDDWLLTKLLFQHLGVVLADAYSNASAESFSVCCFLIRQH